MRLRLVAPLVALLMPAAASAQTPVVNGTCNDAAYAERATWGGSPNGFGDANDLFSLRTYADGTTLYLCLMGELSGTNADGFYLFLDASGYDGIPSGQTLPAGPPTSGFFSTVGGTTLDTGFNADYGFFANAANTPQSLYTNAVRYGVSNGSGLALMGNYLGSSDALGTPASLDGTLLGGSGTLQQAFQNVPYPGNVPGSGTTGWELAIPLSALPGVDASQTLRIVAGIATGWGYFSNEMLPNGMLLGTADVNGNLGSSPNFSAATWTDLFTSPEPLPVELVSFTSSVNGRSARLNWTTASETNNAGFYVEQQNGNAWIAVSNLINGHGTTTERNAYAFDVTGLTAGSHTFRLRQVDTDGAVHYSATTTVEIAAQDGLALTALGARGLRVESEAAATVTVFDLMGRRVLQREVSAGTSVVTLEGVGAGVYVVRAESAGKVATTRLVAR